MSAPGRASNKSPMADFIGYPAILYPLRTLVGEPSMRGVYENPVDGGIWWIHYYAAGKRHREKVGRNLTPSSCIRRARPVRLLGVRFLNCETLKL